MSFRLNGGFESWIWLTTLSCINIWNFIRLEKSLSLAKGFTWVNNWNFAESKNIAGMDLFVDLTFLFLLWMTVSKAILILSYSLVQVLESSCNQEIMAFTITFFNTYYFWRHLTGLFRTDTDWVHKIVEKLIPGLPVPHFRYQWTNFPGHPVPRLLVPWTNGPQIFCPHGKIVPKTRLASILHPYFAATAFSHFSI